MKFLKPLIIGVTLSILVLPVAWFVMPYFGWSGIIVGALAISLAVFGILGSFVYAFLNSAGKIKQGTISLGSIPRILIPILLIGGPLLIWGAWRLR